jgi:hypothetical protein
MSSRGYAQLLTRSVSLAALLIGLAGTTSAARAEDWTKSYPISARAQVRVQTDDGAVNVATGDGKQVEFHVIYDGYQLDKDLHIESRQDGDSVQLTARVSGHWGFSWGGSHRKLRVEVRMPKDADLEVTTGDGSVETQAINGKLRVRTGDGSVHAQAVSGSAQIDTGDGSITLDGAHGDIHLRTGDGHIEAHNLDGKTDATSGDGSVRIDGRLDGLDIKTGDGSIQARVLPGSKMLAPWNIRTGDGSVDISLPADLQADVDASTHDGRISLGIPLSVEGSLSTSQIHGKMNGGGQALSIRTGDGSIRLSKS